MVCVKEGTGVISLITDLLITNSRGSRDVAPTFVGDEEHAHSSVPGSWKAGSFFGLNSRGKWLF